MRLLAALIGGLAGFVIAYFVGAYAACDWINPSSNLCGLTGVFYTGPIGLLVGAVGGWMIAGRRNPAD